MKPEGSLPHSQVPSTYSYCTFFLICCTTPDTFNPFGLSPGAYLYMNLAFMAFMVYDNCFAFYIVLERRLCKTRVNERVSDGKLQRANRNLSHWRRNKISDLFRAQQTKPQQVMDESEGTKCLFIQQYRGMLINTKLNLVLERETLI